MSTPFPNRLVGTIIVAAVVIIFLPDILDGEKQSNKVEFEAIPQAKAFSGELTKKPFPEKQVVVQTASKISSEEAIDEVAMPKSEHKASTDSELTTNKVKNIKEVNKPTVIVNKVTKKLPPKAVAKEAWVIHLGSFKDKSNVAQLLKKLKANGYIAFTKPIKTKQGILTKVIIGPELIQSSLTKKLPSLKKLTGIQGKVAYFVPNK